MGNFILKHPRVSFAIAALAAIIGLYSLSLVRLQTTPSGAAHVFRIEYAAKGLDPEEMDRQKIQKILDAISVVPHIKTTTSHCGIDGTCRVEVVFTQDDDVEQQGMFLQSALRTIPEAKVFRVEESEVFSCAWIAGSGTLPAGFPETTFLQKILSVSGMERLEISGGRNRKTIVTLDTVKLDSLGLGRVAIESSIADAVGASERSHGRIIIDGELSSEESLRRMIVRYNAGTLGRVFLGDISDVHTENVRDESVYCDGKEAVVMFAHARPATDQRKLAATVGKLVEEYSRTLPDNVKMVKLVDEYERSNEFLARAVRMLLASIGFVALALMIMWRSWRLVLVPIIVMIVSILASFSIAKILDWGIDAQILFGFILVSGSLVDSSLLIISLTLDEHKPTNVTDGLRQAVALSLDRSFKPILGGTVVSAICYAPLIFASDVTSVVFLRFAFLGCVALLISAFCALTLVPCLLVSWAKPSVRMLETREPFGPINIYRQCFQRATYILIQGRYLTLAVGIAILVLTIYMAFNSPRPLMPNQGITSLNMAIRNIGESSSEDFEKAIRSATECIAGLEEVKYCVARANGCGQNPNVSDVALIKVGFKIPVHDSMLSQAASALYAAAININSKLVLTGVAPNILAHHQSSGLLDCYIVSPEGGRRDLAEEVGQVKERIKLVAGVADVFCANLDTFRQTSFKLDKPAAEAYGIAERDVADALERRIAPTSINCAAFADVQEVRVMETERKADIMEINIRGCSGALMPIDMLGTISYNEVSKEVERLNNKMAVHLQVLLKPGISPTDIWQDVCAAVNSPYMMHCDALESFKTSAGLRGDWKVVLMSVLFLYLTLVAFYESWRIPIAATLCSALAVFASLSALWFASTHADIYSLAAMMAVMGFAIKGATMVIDAVRRRAKTEQDPCIAAMQGARDSFDLSQMAAWTSVAGLLPFGTSFGVAPGDAGSLGLVAISGLLATAFVGLMMVPGWYAAISRRPANASKGGK